MARSNLIQDAIGVMIVVVVVAAVAIPVSMEALVTDTVAVENDTYSSSGSVPETLTFSPIESGVVNDSETIYVNDSIDGSKTKLTRETDYDVLAYADGEFNITNADPDGDGTDEINSTSDTYLVSYDYKPTGYIESSVVRTIVNYIPLVLGLGVLIAAFALVM